MRVQIKDSQGLVKVGKFIRQRSRAKTLYICARKDVRETLLFAFQDRSMQLLVDVIEPGSVEIDKNAFGNIFDVFTHNYPVNMWTEGKQIKFQQRNFVTALNVLDSRGYDLFETSQEAITEKLLQDEKKVLLARIRAIDKELG